MLSPTHAKKFPVIYYGTPSLTLAPNTSAFPVDYVQTFSNLIPGKHYKLILLTSNTAGTPATTTRTVVLSAGTGSVYSPFATTQATEPHWEKDFVATLDQLKVEYQSNDQYASGAGVNVTSLLLEVD